MGYIIAEGLLKTYKMATSREAGRENSEECIENHLRVAAEQLAFYRHQGNIPPRPIEKDLELLNALIHKTIRLPGGIDIDESGSSMSVNGRTGLPDTQQGMTLYNGAQVALLTAFKIIHGREPTPSEYSILGQGFALISRDLFELYKNKKTGIIREIIHVRDGVDVTLSSD
jgi:hypothetical protein